MLGKTKRNLSPTEKRFFYWGAFTIALLLTSVLPQSTVARTWYIKADGTGDAPTIQAGVDSAAAGDTVLVGPGVYSDTRPVVIDAQSVAVILHMYKNVRVLGQNGPTETFLDGSLAAVGVYAAGLDTTAELAGFSVSTDFEGYGCVESVIKSGGSSYSVPGQVYQNIGLLCRSSNMRIRDNRFTSNRTGMLMEQSSAFVDNNEVFRDFEGISISGVGDVVVENNVLYDCAVLVIAEASSPAIRDNEMFSQDDDMCTAIALAHSSGRISGNKIRGAYSEGINMGNSNPVISDNLFQDNHQGIVDRGGAATIENNIIVGSRTGVSFFANVGTQLAGNTIDDFFVGIVCESGSSPTIRNNILCRGDTGVRCVMFSSPVLECNDVYGVVSRYDGECSDQTGINGNFSLDPEFCGIDDSGNYFLQSDSPCVPGNHPDSLECGLIGAWGVNCGVVKARRSSWGSLKDLYKGDRR